MCDQMVMRMDRHGNTTIVSSKDVDVEISDIFIQEERHKEILERKDRELMAMEKQYEDSHRTNIIMAVISSLTLIVSFIGLFI